MSRPGQPSILPIEHIHIPDVEVIVMPNGVPLHYLNNGKENVVRLDVIVQAGNRTTSCSLEADFTALLLKEGAGNMNSGQIAEIFDYYGAWIQTRTTQQCTRITLYSLTKFLEETLSVLETIIKNPTFPEKEFEILLQNRKRQFSVDMNRVQYLAGRGIVRAIFGKNHPYGRRINQEDFDTLSIAGLKNRYADYYNSGNVKIAMFGKITDDMIKRVEICFGSSVWGKQTENAKKAFAIQPDKEKRIMISKPDAVQSAICVGKQIITRNHPDFHALDVLNTLFGGYFGSRLMSNIRENKGYTYGIYSLITSYLDAGYLNISTQTGTEYAEAVIKEIYTEMNKLQETLIPEKELQTARNYMMGELVRKFDDPFSQAEIYLNLTEFGLDKNFYKQRIDTIRMVAGETLRDLAQRYFVKDDFYEIIAGNVSYC